MAPQDMTALAQRVERSAEGGRRDHVERSAEGGRRGQVDDGYDASERRDSRVVERPLSDVPDAEIAAGLGRGERWAARVLYERIWETLDRTLFRLLKGRGANHEDLAQAVFEHIVRVLSERPHLRVGNLAAWSNVVATRMTVDWLRRRAREARILERFANEHGVGHVNDDRRLEARSDLRWARRALSRMRPKYVETMVLHDILGHDLAEAAAHLNVSVTAAQSRLIRGRRELLRRLRGGATRGPEDAADSVAASWA